MRSLLPTFLVFLATQALPAQDETADTRPPLPREESELVDTLNQDNLQEAIRILLKSYIKRDSLDSLELNRAALQGLLDRGGFGVTLIDRKSHEADAQAEHELVAEQLDDSIAYLRPASYSASEIAEIGDQLEHFTKSKIETLILDLRVPTREASFHDGARLLNHFCPPNELLFKIQKPGEERPTLFLSKPATSWKGDLVILIDQQTPPVGEAVTVVLQRMRDPLVVGSQTPGQTVEYQKVIIGEDAFLRFAVAEVIFAEDESIFRQGITPDLETNYEIADKAYVFDASEKKGMKPFLFSIQQPRHNEASLVAGTNPELDYAIAKSAGRDTGFDTVPIHDRVVQAALDYLVTTSILKAAGEDGG